MEENLKLSSSVTLGTSPVLSSHMWLVTVLDSTDTEYSHHYRKFYCIPQAGIKIAGRNINNLRYANDTTLMAQSEEELKSLLMKGKVESEKMLCLKHNIQKMKIMASGPITSWEIDGQTVETVSDFILGAPKSPQMVTAAMKLKDTYSLEEKL